MKQYFVILMLFPLLLGAQDTNTMANTMNDEIVWLHNYDAAVKQSVKQNKNILVYFTGSDWCAPCKKLKQDFFDTEEFRSLSKAYVLLYIDIPMNKDLLSAKQLEHNKALLPKLNKKNVFPLLKVLDSGERELDELSGYSMNGEIGFHLNLLEKYKG